MVEYLFSLVTKSRGFSPMKFENEKETHLEKAAPSSIVDFLVVICNCHEFERSQGGKGIRL